MKPSPFKALWVGKPAFDREAKPGEIALILALLVVGIGYRASEFLSYSLWLDEAWVGVGAQTKTFEDFLLGLGSTPILFSVSIRLSLAFFQHPELGARFLPLAFSIMALVLAFRLGKEVQGTLGGLLALSLVALQPAFIDYAKQLKHYSADMALALAIVWLGLRFLADRSKRNAWALAVVATLAPGYSHTAMFINLALVAALALDAWLLRHRRVTVSVVSICAPIVVSSIGFFLFAQRYANEPLRLYWQGHYLPGHLVELFTATLDRTLHLLSPGPGFGRLLLLAILWALLLLLRQKRFAAVALVTLVFLESVGAAVVQRYPFGDPRTGHYLTALLLTFAGAGLGSLFSSLKGCMRPFAMAGLIALTIWWGSKIPWDTLGQFKPIEQAAPLIRHIEVNREPSDFVVVYYSSIYVFAYYSSESWSLGPANITIGFQVHFDNPQVIVLPAHRGDNTKYDDEILHIAAQAGPRRIWFLMSHIFGDEASYLSDGFARIGRIEQTLQYPNATLLLIIPNSGSY